MPIEFKPVIRLVMYNATSFADRWVSGRNHTPAKGAASNRGSRVQIPLCPPRDIQISLQTAYLLMFALIKNTNLLYQITDIFCL